MSPENTLYISISTSFFVLLFGMWSSHIFTSYQILTSFKVQLIHEPSMESPLILGRIDFTREGMLSILSKFQFGVMIKNSLHNYTVNLIKKNTSDWWKFYTSIFVLPFCLLQLKKKFNSCFTRDPQKLGILL